MAKPYFSHKLNPLQWIQVGPTGTYFISEDGVPWTPIGENEAITWPNFAELFKRNDIVAVEKHIVHLVTHGVTVLRFMLEYCQTEHRYIERPIGKFQPNMIKLWDDLFSLCEKYGLRILLTPYDTSWMRIRWKYHPYNKINGGPCRQRWKLLLCPDTLKAIKNRLSFAAEHWGGSGVLFAWDLWNEIYPAPGGKDSDACFKFVTELSLHLRDVEMRLYGQSHLQTVSLYSQFLDTYPQIANVIFRHPNLDFATTHFYDSKTINNPKNTIFSATCTGNLVREALEHIHPFTRPFLDTEHGPIHTFRDLKRTLPEGFDNEYFRHMQWAHLASGGAGGGMRWPNRHPHILTEGMRTAQKSLSNFVKYINWPRFKRKNLNLEIELSSTSFIAFSCGDEDKAIVWLVRRNTLKGGMLDRLAKALPVNVVIPGLLAGNYSVFYWDTLNGVEVKYQEVKKNTEECFKIEVDPVITDIAIAIVRK